MNIVIATAATPFCTSRESDVVNGLERELQERGHRVETYGIPFVDDWHLAIEELATFRLIEVPGADRMITFRAPSHVMEHRHKVAWLCGSPDETFQADRGIPDTARGRATREAIRRADNVAFERARSVFATSSALAVRLRGYSAVEAPILYPPLSGPRRFRNEGGTGYVLALGDVSQQNRLSMLLDAMRHVRTPVRLVIALEDGGGTGRSTDLMRQFETHDFGDRVNLIDRPLQEDERIALIARASAMSYIPAGGFGWVSPVLEAAAASKPVITTGDSECAALLVDGERGWVCDPLPRSLADCFDEAFADASLARRRGEALARRIDELGIDWATTVERLLA